MSCNQTISRLGVLVLSILMVLQSGYIEADESGPSDIQFAEEALKLYELKLLKGTDKGFELDRPATRTEAIVMLIRLLGEEEAALEWEGNLPFSDVPDWAISYIGYAYAKGYTHGIGPGVFGADLNVTSRQFLTLVLRALHYDDSEGDFEYENAVLFASQSMLVPYEVYDQYQYTDDFLRDDCVGIAYKAVMAKRKGVESTLLHDLAEKGQVSKEVLLEMGLLIHDPLYGPNSHGLDSAYFTCDTRLIKAYYPTAKYMYTVYTESQKASEQFWINEIEGGLEQALPGNYDMYEVDKINEYFMMNIRVDDVLTTIGHIGPWTPLEYEKVDKFGNLFIMDEDLNILELIRYCKDEQGYGFHMWDHMSIDVMNVVGPTLERIYEHFPVIIPVDEINYHVSSGDGQYWASIYPVQHTSVGIIKSAAIQVYDAGRSVYDMNEDELKELVTRIYSNDLYWDESINTYTSTGFESVLDTEEPDKIAEHRKYVIYFLDSTGLILGLSEIPLIKDVEGLE